MSQPPYPGPYGQQPPPGGGPYAPPPPGRPYPPPPTPPRKSWPRRHKFLTLLLSVAGLLVIIVVAASAGGGGTNTSTTPQPSTASQPSSAPAASNVPGIGTPVRDGKFQFTVTSVSQAKSVGDVAAGLGETAQGAFTILHLTVQNIGDQPQTLSDSAQYVYDAAGRKYSANSAADISLNKNGGVFLNGINPGNSVTGLIAFDMPVAVQAVKAELHDSLFSGGITVSLR
jgi:hypothetical protein